MDKDTFRACLPAWARFGHHAGSRRMDWGILYSTCCDDAKEVENAIQGRSGRTLEIQQWRMTETRLRKEAPE